MTHYSGEILTQYVSDPGAEMDRPAIRTHVAKCGECRVLLNSIEEEQEALTDPTTWMLTDKNAAPEEFDVSDAVKSLLMQAASEDEEAATLLSHISTNAPAIAIENLLGKRRYHTAGVVRFLCRAARYLLQRNPPDALIIAKNATAVAGALKDEAAYPAALRQTLIGSAWIERASVLYMMGDYTASLNAFDRAERELQGTPTADAERARIIYGKAVVYQYSEKHDRAVALALESAERFRMLGDEARRINSLVLIGAVRQRQSLFAEARETYLALIPQAAALGDEVLVAALRLNVAWAAMEIGLLAESESEFSAALSVFETHGLSTEVCRTRWGLARLPLLRSEYQIALDRLLQIFEEARRLELKVVAGLIVIDIAESLIGLQRRHDVPPLCKYAISVFRWSGRDESLLMAIAYLREASGVGSVKPDTLTYLRSFLREFERRPELMFVPPPPG